MQQRVLTQDQARCRPARKPCGLKDNCARFTCAIPPVGGAIADYSFMVTVDARTGGPWCAYHLSARMEGKPEEIAHPVKPWPSE